MDKVRRVIVYGDEFWEFYYKQIQKVQERINWTIGFFDKGKLIILLNGFQKKTQKTPSNEIAKAEKLKKQYYEDKGKEK